VDGRIVGNIDAGLLVFVGIADGDGPADIEYMASKIREMRIFADEQGRMNRSVVDAGGAVLVVSQFTLMGDVRKGRRPNYMDAAPPEQAEPLYRDYCRHLQDAGIPVATGRFGAEMTVTTVGDGPVTILLDSERLF
jgi:D-tyrosyl-tRNA(Tyr) deacylase